MTERLLGGAVLHVSEEPSKVQQKLRPSRRQMRSRTPSEALGQGAHLRCGSPKRS